MSLTHKFSSRWRLFVYFQYKSNDTKFELIVRIPCRRIIQFPWMLHGTIILLSCKSSGDALSLGLWKASWGKKGQSIFVPIRCSLIEEEGTIARSGGETAGGGREDGDNQPGTFLSTAAVKNNNFCFWGWTTPGFHTASYSTVPSRPGY